MPLARVGRTGFIAAADARKLVPQDAERQMEYAVADKRHQFRIAAENPRKYDVVAVAARKWTSGTDHW